MKTCTKCGVSKVLACFGKHKSTKDGLRHLCRKCNNAAARKWGRNNPEKAAELARRWAAKNPGRRQEITRAWLAENPERDRTNKQKYYTANKEIFLAKGRKWADENRLKVRKQKAAWRQKNKPIVRAMWARRHANQLRATPAWLTAIQLAQIQEFYEIADARTMQTGEVHHVDHIHPLQGKNFRGLHVPWNLQVLTAFDNVSKGNKLPTTFG